MSGKKFKVGDKVVINITSNLNSFKKGDEGVVLSNSNTINTYDIGVTLSDERIIFFMNSELELKESVKNHYTTTKPDYYLGITHKYEASKVIEDFQSDNYNIGTAITYLLRAGKKIYVNDSALDSKREDIEKAIAHLNFELDRL